MKQKVSFDGSHMYKILCVECGYETPISNVLIVRLVLVTHTFRLTICFIYWRLQLNNNFLSSFKNKLEEKTKMAANVQLHFKRSRNSEDAQTIQISAKPYRFHYLC